MGNYPDQMIAGCMEVLRRGQSETQANRATAYTNRGWAYNQKNEHDQAIADLTEALRLEPKLAYAYTCQTTPRSTKYGDTQISRGAGDL